MPEIKNAGSHGLLSEGPGSVATAFDPEDEYRPEPVQPPQPPAWKDGSIRIGIHTSIAGDIAESLETAHRLGANAVQIFSGSPRMWPSARGGQGMGARIPEADAGRFRARRTALGLGPVVVHGNYLINLASPERVLRVRSIQTFRDEVIRAMALGADYLVAHPGSSRGTDKVRAIQDVSEGLRQALRGLRLGNPSQGSGQVFRVLLENTAGQGSVLGGRLEELKAILDVCSDWALGVCLDTAHLFAAGYPIQTAEGLERTLEAIERTVGLRRVFVLHVNDSKAPFGSHVDRHEHIGKGKIGLEAFRRILNHPLLAGRAFVLETPIDRPGDDLRNVQTLWRLVGIRPRGVRGARDGFRAKASRKKKKQTQKRGSSVAHRPVRESRGRARRGPRSLSRAKPRGKR